jgi:hypothetical protein
MRRAGVGHVGKVSATIHYACSHDLSLPEGLGAIVP